MKVGLISSHSFINPGGVQRHILGLKAEFERRGICSKVIIPKRAESENYGRDVILLGTSFPVILGGTQADFGINFNPWAIERVLEKEKFDILHFHNFIPPFAWQILEKSNSVNVLTLHANPRGSKFLNHFPGLLPLWRKMINWKIDGLIGVSSLTLEGFEDFKGPKTVIPNGIDLTEFKPEAPKVKKYDDGKINLLFVGRIEERKGLIYLLKAYQILERDLPPKFGGGLRLLIVGEGPLKTECQRFVREQGLREIYFEGEKTNQELVSYYNTTDIFVSPAIFGESFGLVLIEAMACGKPVVAFAIEGYKEVLTGKGTKFLAKPRDYKALAQKLEILIKNEKLRKEIGDWGLKEAKKYSWQKVANQVLNFYQLCWQDKQKREKTKSFSLEKQINKIFSEMF